MDIGIVLATGAAQVMRDLETVIARNGAVALLCDRDLKRRGVEVEFFGERTTMPAGPASLAVRTGAPLFPVATYFDGRGHHVVIKPPIDVPSDGERSTRIKQTTQLLAKELEQLILAATALASGCARRRGTSSRSSILASGRERRAVACAPW